MNAKTICLCFYIVYLEKHLAFPDLVHGSIRSVVEWCTETYCCCWIFRGDFRWEISRFYFFSFELWWCDAIFHSLCIHILFDELRSLVVAPIFFFANGVIGIFKYIHKKSTIEKITSIRCRSMNFIKKIIHAWPAY